jgi:hypothetical protein
MMEQEFYQGLLCGISLCIILYICWKTYAPCFIVERKIPKTLRPAGSRKDDEGKLVEEREKREFHGDGKFHYRKTDILVGSSDGNEKN